jgi:hypothetical protein
MEISRPNATSEAPPPFTRRHRITVTRSLAGIGGNLAMAAFAAYVVFDRPAIFYPFFWSFGCLMWLGRTLNWCRHFVRAHREGSFEIEERTSYASAEHEQLSQRAYWLTNIASTPMVAIVAAVVVMEPPWWIVLLLVAADIALWVPAIRQWQRASAERQSALLAYAATVEAAKAAPLPLQPNAEAATPVATPGHWWTEAGLREDVQQKVGR